MKVWDTVETKEINVNRINNVRYLKAYSSLQSAIDSLPTDGGCIFVDKGNYTVSSPITINKHVTLIGEGSEHSILTLASGVNDYMIKINSTNSANQYRCNFYGIKFSGNMAGNTAGGCIIAYGCVQSSWHKCHFENFYNYGLYLYDCGGGSGAFGHHNQVIDCLFDQGESSSGLGIGVYMRNNDENALIGSQFQYNKIGVKDESGFNMIDSCSFVDGLQGIYILDSSRTRVINCIFDYCAQEGIRLKGPFNVVNGCTFYRCSDGTSTYSCLYIDWYGANIISSNMFIAENSSNKTKGAIEEVGNASEDTYGHNLIANNMFCSTATSTSLATSNWATGALIETNTNDKSNNVTRVS